MVSPWITLTLAALGLGMAPSGDDSLPEGALVRFGSWNLRHRDPVHFVAFAGERLVSGAMDGSVRAWDVESGELADEYAQTEGSFVDGRIAPDGRVVLLRGDSSLHVWTPGAGAAKKLLDEVGTRFDLSPDGRLACVVARDELARVVDLEAGQVVREHPMGELYASAAAYSPGGERLALASLNRSKLLNRGGTETEISSEIRILSAATGEELQRIGSASLYVHDLAWTPDGSEVVATDDKGGLRTWSADGGVQRRDYLPEAPAEAVSIALSPDGSTAAIPCRDGRLQLVPLADEGEARIVATDGLVGRVAFSPDGEHLAAARAAEVEIWSYPELEALHTLPRHSGPVSSIAWSPDGERVLTGGYDRTARVWDAATGEQLRELSANAGFVFGVAYGRDLLAAGGQDGRVRVWDDAGVQLFELLNHKAAATALALSPDGGTLASAGADGVLQLVNPLTGEARHTIPGLKGLQFVLAWSPSGDRVAVGAADVSIYDAQNGELLQTIPRGRAPLTALAWSPDGATLALGRADRSIHLIELASGADRGLQGHLGRVKALAFSPDGKRLASSSSNESAIRLWDPAAARQARVFEGGYAREVLALAYSPDGRRLAGASMDGTALVWDCAEEDED
ncbi:MAG: WD40 repeat domain-containing protein [Planctomycetota bacterium]